MRLSSQSFSRKQDFQIFCAVNLEWGGGAGWDGGVYDYKALSKTHKVNRF